MSFIPVGQIRYPVQHQMAGTTFYSSSGATIDADGELYALCFSVPRTGKIKYVYWRIYTCVAAGDIEATFETYDESTGQPTGTLYDTNCTAVTHALLTSDDNKVIVTEFATPCTVTVGTNICFVLKRPTGSAYTGQVHQGSDLTCYDQSRNNNFPHTAAFTGTWAYGQTTYHIRHFTLEYEDGVCIAPMTNPVGTGYTATTFNSGSATNKRGVVLELPACRIVALQTVCAYSGPSNTTNVKLYDASGRVVIATDVNGDAKGGTSILQYRYHVEPTSVPAGTYYLMVEPSSTLNVTTYDLTLYDRAGDGRAYAQWPGGWAVAGASFPFARVGAGVLGFHHVIVDGFYTSDATPRTRIARTA